MCRDFSILGLWGFDGTLNVQLLDEFLAWSHAQCGVFFTQEILPHRNKRPFMHNAGCFSARAAYFSRHPFAFWDFYYTTRIILRQAHVLPMAQPYTSSLCSGDMHDGPSSYSHSTGARRIGAFASRA
jgi:hypothetical protein